MGRTPKPTALARGKRAANPHEPQPKLLQTRLANEIAREFLISSEAKRLWPYLYEPLRDARLATEADTFALLELAESIAEMREGRLRVRELEESISQLRNGVTLGDGAALVDEETMAQLNMLERMKGTAKLDIKWAYDRVRDLMSGMGCTPAARSKIKLDDAQSDMFVDAMRMIDVRFVDTDDEPGGAVPEESPSPV